MHRDREKEREILAHFESMDREQKKVPGTNLCYACEYGPTYRHNWKPGQCKHASVPEEAPDEWVMPEDNTIETWPPYDC